MSEDKKDDKNLREKKLLGIHSGNFWKSFKIFFAGIIRIEETDFKGTVENIKKDMVFRGPTAWILIFSILIASIGLNANSIPVIIGAMLISPLMGPIVAVGLSIGTNDFQLLKRATLNYIVAFFISIITSAIYFLLSPLKEATSELLIRTSPTILDVFIAFFGGFAGIIAGSRRDRGTAIPGVAIATALMPPLCTAGYGLATWQMNFFFGAIYLFFINSTFISLATIITVKFLDFPQKKFIEKKRKQQIKKWMSIFIIIMIIPSILIFFKVIKESRFDTNAKLFVKDVIVSDKSQLLNSTFEFNDTTAVINLYFIGDAVQDSAINNWMIHLNEYNLVSRKNWFNKIMLPDTTIIKVYQTGKNGQITQKDLQLMNQTIKKELRIGVLEDIYKKNEEIIDLKNKKIRELEEELTLRNKHVIPINQLYKELNVQYPRIIAFSYGQNVKIVNDTLTDTIPTFILKWKYGTSNYYKRKKLPTLKDWLKVRFNLDTLMIVEEK